MDYEKALNQAIDLIADQRESEAEKVLLGFIQELKEEMDGTIADADRYHQWGQFLYLMNEHQQALLQYEQALQIRPDHIDSLWEIVSIFLYDLDKPASAKSLLEQALIPLRPNSSQFAEALQAAETLIRRQKGQPLAPPEPMDEEDSEL